MSDQNSRVSDLETELAQTQRQLQKVTAQLARFEEERMAILTVRDYALGMEQSYGRAQFDLAEKDTLIAELRREIIATHRHLAEAIADSQKTHARLAEALRIEPLRARVMHKAGLVARRVSRR